MGPSPRKNMTSFESPETIRSATRLPQEEPGSETKKDYHKVGQRKEHTPVREIRKTTMECPHCPRRKGYEVVVDEHIGDASMCSLTAAEQSKKGRDDMAAQQRANDVARKRAEDNQKAYERQAAESREANRRFRE